MKHLLPLLILLFATSCGDNIPPLDTIEGRWTSVAPDRPDWTYDFHQGLAVFSTPAYTQEYVYAEIGDTLHLGGDGHTAPRRWVLRFENAARVHITRIDYPIYPEIILERTE